MDTKSYTEAEIERAEKIIAAAQEIAVEDGQALYLVDDKVVLGKDGCQPSNSMCLAVGPTDDEDWSELQHSVIVWYREITAQAEDAAPECFNCGDETRPLRRSPDGALLCPACYADMVDPKMINPND